MRQICREEPVISLIPTGECGAFPEHDSGTRVSGGGVKSNIFSMHRTNGFDTLSSIRIDEDIKKENETVAAPGFL